MTLSVLVFIRMVSRGLSASSSSLIGQNKECQKLGRVSLTSLDKSIKQRNSLDKMDPSACTAGAPDFWASSVCLSVLFWHVWVPNIILLLSTYCPVAPKIPQWLVFTGCLLGVCWCILGIYCLFTVCVSQCWCWADWYLHRSEHRFREDEIWRCGRPLPNC